jgi:F-type H+-transporting ATPase subunit a
MLNQGCLLMQYRNALFARLSACFSVLFATLLVALSFSGSAYAAGGLIAMNNWYYVAAEALFGSRERAVYWWPVLSAAFVIVIIVALGLLTGLYRKDPKKLSDEELLPPKSFGLVGFVESMWAIASSTLSGVIGKGWENYATLLGGTFFFIVLSNLSGLVPGFAPATEHMNTTLAIALIIFIGFNYVGLKHGGVNYLKHLLGPVWWLAWLMLPIEVISIMARPVSQSLRLFGNISGDHLVFNVFSTIMRDAGTPFLPVPAAILVFGTLVAILQAFIFVTLSAVYVRLSLDTADHH